MKTKRMSIKEKIMQGVVAKSTKAAEENVNLACV